ncbi:MAG: substrate-binding domain-containing protein [Spirochaetales bacterium]|nr:substrate-binding domain-containing protein [Spirochaetales bacterium]
MIARLLIFTLLALPYCQKKSLTRFCSVGSAEMNALMDNWNRLHVAAGEQPLQHEGRGNGVAHLALSSQTCLFAAVSRKLTNPEIHRIVQKTGDEVQHIPVGLDAIAIITRSDHKATSISPQSVFQIYHEGPENSQFSHAYRINTASERYQFFQSVAVKNESIADTVLEVPDTVRAVEAVIQSGGIAFVRPADVIRGVKVLPLEMDYHQPVQPEERSVASGLYPYTRHLYLVLPARLPAHEESIQVIRFMETVLSEEGQKILRPLGFFPLDAASLSSSRHLLADLKKKQQQ